MIQSQHTPLADQPALIEHSFPVAKLSAESYKERKAGSGQRLTGIGKWWGRKPLVLVRASILGALLPATDDPQKDNEVFERLMGMDDFGLYERRTRKALSKAQFDAMTPEEQLKGAILAEAYEGPSDEESWKMINDHLGTNAHTLQEVVEQLGVMRFGEKPKVGDVFSGGGSIPFEAARLGCDTYASDLNPVAALLTWSNQALLCATPEDKERIDAAQKWVYEEVDRQITEWGIEHDEQGRRADAYLWCNEVLDPETGYMVPLAATWVISVKDRVVAELVPDDANKRYDIRVVTGASDEQMKKAKQGTVVDQQLVPPPTKDNPQPHKTQMSKLRDRHNNGQGLRAWHSDDLVPSPDDFYQERLYCVRWIDSDGNRNYEAVTPADEAREAKALALLHERWRNWQEDGFIPSRAIEEGPRAGRIFAGRNWRYWSNLFTPRQLLTNGLFAANISRSNAPKELLVLLGKLNDNNSKMCRWNEGGSKPNNVFNSQSINPIYNYAVRGSKQLHNQKIDTISHDCFPISVGLSDARLVATNRDLWITDPPYADAIDYEEISEYFLSWYEKRIPNLFPDWYTDTRRALAVKGKGTAFNESMIEVYSNLTHHMPNNGMQIVMFTHQDAEVWADLAMTMWASGLRVSAAWTVATETTDGINGGDNYVQGTVLLVLRKRGEVETLFDDEILTLMEQEASKQLKDMQLLEGAGLRWSDADLQLATYAAALRVITSHDIDGIDPRQELLKVRAKGEKSPVHRLIEQASQVASRELMPRGLDPAIWRDLGAHERFYLKGLDTENRGEHRSGVYQELSKGFAATSWRDLLGDERANHVRLQTASEMGSRSVTTGPLAGTLLRHVLMAIQITAREGEPEKGIAWLQGEVPSFDMQQTRTIKLLEHLGKQNLPHWTQDAAAARLLRGALMNIGV
ncbi:anti-phage-associated DUF1156 domain-containing protein [Deinococcus wulumuqiensis]|uniref:DNA methylase n=1 Tax=Deinococcus wulumuqiensis TaxID=980427 RepID=A0AAV4K4W7_9DEIO|nr:anti-phage-associated DUF1156 domain-containing protein [Deinococcus wulumuqiensis]QII19951.1 DUF1156 domain-containing protein [Deinococcus wulumuqiensis R12]GGI74245.1 DNA methylase [Deinococcus wulumuqiensis]GGP29848.1 DNA methylase [Deinococcus wulumuqiensis]